MMQEKQTATYYHDCSSCGYYTEEIYENRQKVPVFEAEKRGKKQFLRTEYNGRIILGCPHCGTVLPGSDCERIVTATTLS